MFFCSIQIYSNHVLLTCWLFLIPLRPAWLIACLPTKKTHTTCAGGHAEGQVEIAVQPCNGFLLVLEMAGNLIASRAELDRSVSVKNRLTNHALRLSSNKSRIQNVRSLLGWNLIWSNQKFTKNEVKLFEKHHDQVIQTMTKLCSRSLKITNIAFSGFNQSLVVLSSPPLLVETAGSQDLKYMFLNSICWGLKKCMWRYLYYIQMLTLPGLTWNHVSFSKAFKCFGHRLP